MTNPVVKLSVDPLYSLTIKKGDDVIPSNNFPGMVIKNNKTPIDYKLVIGYAVTDQDDNGNIMVVLT